MSVKEISERSGLPIFEVIELSRLRDWDSVKVSTVRKFTHGCGIDLDDPVSVKRKLVYMAGYKKGDKRMPPRFRYLRRSESWDSFYKPLIMEWTNDAK